MVVNAFVWECCQGANWWWLWFRICGFGGARERDPTLFLSHDDLWFSVFKFQEIEARSGGVNFWYPLCDCFCMIYWHLCLFKISMSSVSVKSPALGVWTGMDFLFFQIRLWWSIFYGVKLHGKVVGAVILIVNNGVVGCWVVIIGMRLYGGRLCALE